MDSLGLLSSIKKFIDFLLEFKVVHKIMLLDSGSKYVFLIFYDFLIFSSHKRNWYERVFANFLNTEI